MTQYNDLMTHKREQLAAEEWGKTVASIHAFNTEQVTMWYDNRLKDGSVMDIIYNNGRIKRMLPSGKTIWIGEPLSKKSMLESFRTTMEDIRHGLR